jgi:hypothetical protein
MVKIILPGGEKKIDKKAQLLSQVQQKLQGFQRRNRKEMKRRKKWTFALQSLAIYFIIKLSFKKQNEE